MNASIDDNGTRTIIGALNTDNTLIQKICADISTSALCVDDDVTGTVGPSTAPRDENGTTGLMAVSSSDGKTPIALQVDSGGNLLVSTS